MRYRVDDLLVDLDHRRISRDGYIVALPDLSWRVFAALLEKAPDPVSFRDLAAIAWRRDHVSADTLSQRVKLLRQALGDDPAAPRYIATERGIGYRLAAAPQILAPRGPGRSAKMKWLAGGVAGFAVIALLVFVVVTLPRSSTTTPSPSNASTISADELVDRGGVYLARGSYDDNENALRLFRQALNADPEHIRGLTGLSFALSHRATKYDFSSETALEAQSLAEKAVSLSPRSAPAWHALGLSKDAQGRVTEALRAYEQAIAIDPKDVNAVASAAYLLQIQGRFHEALLLEKQALDNGAPTLFSYLQIATALHLAGLDDDADAWRAKAETLTPDNLLLKDIQAEYYLTIGDFERAAVIAAPSANPDRRAALDARYGEALLALGRTEEARTAFGAAKKRDENDATGAFELAALAYRLSERTSPAAEDPMILALHKARKAGDQWPESSVSGAYIYASAGDGAGAIDLLHNAYQLGYRNFQRLRYSPFFTSLRETPEFSALLADMETDAAAQRLLIINDPRLASFVTSAP